MSLAEAQNFGRPYAESPAASAALAATMDRLDFGKLLKEVDEEYRCEVIIVANAVIVE